MGTVTEPPAPSGSMHVSHCGLFPTVPHLPIWSFILATPETVYATPSLRYYSAHV
jgi:hypothetical protein